MTALTTSNIPSAPEPLKNVRRRLGQLTSQISSGPVWRRSDPAVEPIGSTARPIRIVVAPDLSQEAVDRLVGHVRKIVSFYSLPEGWDGHRGRPLTSEALDIAINMLTLSASFEPSAQVVPLPSGGVQLEWHVAGNALEVEVDAKGSVHVLAETSEGEIIVDREANPLFIDVASDDVRRNLRRMSRILLDLR